MTDLGTDFSWYEEMKAPYRTASNQQYIGNGHDGSEPLLAFDPTALDGIPVPLRVELVPGWIPYARATGIYGAGGEGKTLLAQMLATSCATGALWLGLDVQQCRSLLLFCEDDRDEMHRRQDDINRAYGCGFCDLGAMRWLPRLGEDNALMTFEDGRRAYTKLFSKLLAAAKEHRAKLIITDTLADVFQGNENDRAQVRAFVQQGLGLLARETQGAVIALAHPSRAGISSGSGESGSTAWIGTFRSQLHLSAPKPEAKASDADAIDPDLRILTRRKSNAARRDETIELRWKDGVFVPLYPKAGIIGSMERQTCEHVFLEILDQMEAEGQSVSSNSKAGNYAPRLFSQRPNRERLRTADFQRAMHQLFFDKAIRNEPYGRKSDIRYRIVRA